MTCGESSPPLKLPVKRPKPILKNSTFANIYEAISVDELNAK